MAKRTATSELNHDNWDQDEDPEDSGMFQKASDETLKRRIIKTARRRNPISSVRDAEPGTKSAFTGFTGFSKTPTPSTTSFSFLTDVTKHTEKPKTNGTSAQEVDSTEIKKSNPSSNANISIFANKESSIPAKDTKGKSNDYYSKLKGLNESVSNWIKQHVDANPLINLQPIFKDYERFFKELEQEEDNRTETKPADSMKTDGPTSSMSTFVFKAATNIPDSSKAKTGQEPEKSDANKYSFGSYPMLTTSAEGIPKFGFSSTATSNTFSFGTSISSSKSSVTPSLTFGGNVSTPKTTSFSFTSSTPFTFNNVSKPASSGEPKKDSDDESDEPPKVEFTPVVEKDHVYTTRCKMFVKKDGTFGDRGVGNLYIKPIEDSEKVQVIIRADTNLGNLLCNFILSANIPTKRMGKKDVMLVCLPTPDFKPPPVPILLRVKSPEEADKLLEVLEKHKK